MDKEYRHRLKGCPLCHYGRLFIVEMKSDCTIIYECDMCNEQLEKDVS